jgi:hypothetical protein
MYYSPHIHVCWGNDIFVESDEEEVSEGQMKQLKQIEPMNQRIMEESVGISIGLSELVEVSMIVVVKLLALSKHMNSLSFWVEE